ncbi:MULTISPECIES: EpsG family protein [Clostridia]|uniref:EpsG family protein n=1 Tax=Clostridia TaxID=186801 RepID=UPI000E4C2822|nr:MULTISPECIES: EpsG family protein [Clostridia]RHV70464.1 EpsG family protein [Roseburia sp. OM02-15]
MYWLYGAYIASIIMILLIELTKKYSVNKDGFCMRRYYNPILVFIYICPLVYVAACRYKFWDTDDYRLMYEAVGKTIANVFNNSTGHVEKGYLLFTALLNKISRDSQFLIIVSSIFIIFGICFFLYKESTDVPLSFVIFSSQIWMSTMNGLRQYIVAALLWLAWRKWSKSIHCKKNDLIFIISIIIMASFHKSVLICIPLFLCARGKLLNKKVLFCIIAAISMAVISPIYNWLFGFLLGGTEYANYVDTNATMGISRFVISCFPIFLIWIYYFICLKNSNDRSDKAIWMMNLSCINFAFNILALKMVYFARIGIYFSIFDLLVIPYCIEKYFTEKSRVLMKVLLMIFYIFFFYRQLLAYGGYATNFQLFYEVK